MEARDSRNSATLTGNAASRRFVGANITSRDQGRRWRGAVGAIGPAAYHGAGNRGRRWCRFFRGLARSFTSARARTPVLREDFGTFGFLFFTTLPASSSPPSAHLSSCSSINPPPSATMVRRLPRPAPPHAADHLCEQSTAIKSVKAIAPLLDRILVQRIKAEAKTASGIFLPESSVKELNEAKVLAVGPGAFDKDGKRITPSLAPGDKVLIPQVRPRISRHNCVYRSGG